MLTDADQKNPSKSQTRQAKPRRQTEEEVLREQSRTETEEHPYLDTEGGE